MFGFVMIRVLFATTALNMPFGKKKWLLIHAGVWEDRMIQNGN